jgi:hypothetical protein
MEINLALINFLNICWSGNFNQIFFLVFRCKSTRLNICYALQYLLECFFSIVRTKAVHRSKIKINRE